MRKKFKFGILIIILAVPVLIYLFLKGFGENEFSVPVFYTEGIDPDSFNCGVTDQQHIVNFHSVVSGVNYEQSVKGRLIVVDADIQPYPIPNPVGNPLQRISDLAKVYPSIQILSLRPYDDTEHNQVEEVIYVGNEWHLIPVKEEKLAAFGRCQLVFPEFDPGGTAWDKRLVLVDQSGRIRGYYDADDYQETDRLLLEIKIILGEEY